MMVLKFMILELSFGSSQVWEAHEDFVEWLQQVEKISDYMGLDDKKNFTIAIIQLTKKAGIWFNNLNARTVRAGKEKIVTWMDFKEETSCKVYFS